MTATPAPTGTLDARYSRPDARPSRWGEVSEVLDTAETYWLSTVRSDGRPHVTPLIGIWDGTSLYFSTGDREQKAHNLATNPNVSLTTGNNALQGGLDVVAEGTAVRIGDPGRLASLAAAWVGKYGEVWRFEVRDGDFWHEGGGLAGVYEVTPTRVFAFRKGDDRFAQTGWRLG
ncbi:pyridoxamine 5'-phosphate oxidase family protein [Nocardiopsis sediminis]|uniref:Pyridoxamine 5'-phosphate oxidase family protein n=1 Tax=Nocardiopsis sediminis TaxID=1778267 RepID=A0ABV8FMS2_9ACTN